MDTPVDTDGSVVVVVVVVVVDDMNRVTIVALFDLPSVHFVGFAVALRTHRADTVEAGPFSCLVAAVAVDMAVEDKDDLHVAHHVPVDMGQARQYSIAAAASAVAAAAASYAIHPLPTQLLIRKGVPQTYRRAILSRVVSLI